MPEIPPKVDGLTVRDDFNAINTVLQNYFLTLGTLPSTIPVWAAYPDCSTLSATQVGSKSTRALGHVPGQVHASVYREKHLSLYVCMRR